MPKQRVQVKHMNTDIVSVVIVIALPVSKICVNNALLLSSLFSAAMAKEG